MFDSHKIEGKCKKEKINKKRHNEKLKNGFKANKLFFKLVQTHFIHFYILYKS